MPEQPSRRLTIRDLAAAKDHLAQLMEQHGKTRLEALASLAQVLFSSTEFRFIE